MQHNFGQDGIFTRTFVTGHMKIWKAGICLCKFRLSICL